MLLVLDKIANLFQQKDLTGEHPSLIAKARLEKGSSQNGMESTENRRSVGRNGNQHVYVRDPQVSGATRTAKAEPRQQWRGFPVGSVARHKIEGRARLAVNTP
jgi:hypothetical protein